MIETIYIGMSGLTGYSSGLRGIANNVANLNTPGFKGSSLSFSSLFYSADGSGGTREATVGPRFGHGVLAGGASLDWRQGDLRQTGQTLDLAIEGDGLFVLRDEAGSLLYSRAGQFAVDDDGMLVHRDSRHAVMGLGPAGQLVPLEVATQSIDAPRPTGRVRFSGNLSSTKAEESVSGITVVDASGLPHALTLTLTHDNATEAGRWTLALKDGTTSVGTAAIRFVDGQPVADEAQPTVLYTPAGSTQALSVTLDFSQGVTSFASGSLSTLSASGHDGHEAAAMSKFSVDAQGRLQLEFTNGERREGGRLALAEVDSLAQLVPVGGNGFTLAAGAQVRHGAAGSDALGAIRSGALEMSNVDLSREFSDMVILQRGYQASAQVVSTANDMLQELFGMKR